ncbi:hypothetical protein Ciccas_008570 [Cichlidogyrus casuarinus]|uniref:Uncharacterized protein n=1 Tax=Cichlidogyrus casuarinus TaxID=1844966 RepID=A0ABD2Q3U1_9PLAT
MRRHLVSVGNPRERHSPSTAPLYIGMLSGTPITRRALFRRYLSAASAAFPTSPSTNDSWLGLKCRTTSGDLRSALIAVSTSPSRSLISLSGSMTIEIKTKSRLTLYFLLII